MHTLDDGYDLCGDLCRYCKEADLVLVLDMVVLGGVVDDALRHRPNF